VPHQWCTVPKGDRHGNALEVNDAREGTDVLLPAGVCVQEVEGGVA
jgi:hypothetical protein